MVKLLYALVILIAFMSGILCGASIALPKVIEVPVPVHKFKTYAVSFVNDPTIKPFDIPADGIERRDGCVLFLRTSPMGPVLDTVVCPAAMDRLIVTEKN